MNKLREAAQAVIDTVDIHGVYRPEIFEAFERLRDALAEPETVDAAAAWAAARAAMDAAWVAEVEKKNWKGE